MVRAGSVTFFFLGNVRERGAIRSYLFGGSLACGMVSAGALLLAEWRIMFCLRGGLVGRPLGNVLRWGAVCMVGVWGSVLSRGWVWFLGSG